jgi:hypothetical protein
MKMKHGFRIVIAILFLTVGGSEAFSCTCPHPPSQRTYFRKAKAVFIGQVIEISEGGRDAYSGQRAYLIRFKVEKSWKGVKGDDVVASTTDVGIDNNTRTCGGFNFVKGERYLIYAYVYEHKLKVSSGSGNDCTPPTSSLGAASKDVKRLNSRWFRFTSRVLPF